MEFINEYHKLYERSRIWEKNSWLGEPAWKLPMDMMVIQELIFKLEPDYVIETGTGFGGSALFYASIMELMGHGQVITCDIEKRHILEDHPLKNVTKRIEFIGGSSTNPLTIDQIAKIVGDTRDNIVILDSDHRCDHVCQEMGSYEHLVGPNYYMIVEDSHAGRKGHPIEWEWDNDGPYEAIEFFLEVNKDFEVDWECEKHLMTFQPKGYLRRVQ